MVVTEYTSLYSTDGKVKNYSWDQFCLKISRPVVSIGTTWDRFQELPKSSDDYDDETQQGIKMKAGGAVFGEMFTSEEVTPGRKKENYPTRSAIALDYEQCDESIFERIHNALEGYTYAYHTTCKHRPPDDCRLHVIVPFAKEVSWQLYSVMAVLIAKSINAPSNWLDKTCLRRAQMLLYCVKLRDCEYVYHTQTEQFLDVEQFLLEKFGTLNVKEITEKAKIDWETEGIKELVKRHNKNNIPMVKTDGRAYKPRPVKAEFVSHEAKPGDVKGCFNSCFSCRDILDKLPEYIPCGERYTYFKASSSRGVWVSDDGTRCGSFHSNSGDPLFGRSMTAFDVFLLFFTDKDSAYKDRLKTAHEYALQNRADKYKKLFYTDTNDVLKSIFKDR